MMVEVEAEARLQEGERRDGGPGLRRAGDRVRSRTLTLLPREAAEQLGQPAQVHVDRSVEYSLETTRRMLLEPVPRHSECDKCIVLRPHRADGIGNWILPRLRSRPGADAPPRTTPRD